MVLPSLGRAYFPAWTDIAQFMVYWFCSHLRRSIIVANLLKITFAARRSRSVNEVSAKGGTRSDPEARKSHNRAAILFSISNFRVTRSQLLDTLPNCMIVFSFNTFFTLHVMLFSIKVLVDEQDSWKAVLSSLEQVSCSDTPSNSSQFEDEASSGGQLKDFCLD